MTVSLRLRPLFNLVMPGGFWELSHQIRTKVRERRLF
jgi:hypothetical protein